MVAILCSSINVESYVHILVFACMSESVNLVNYWCKTLYSRILQIHDDTYYKDKGMFLYGAASSPLDR